MSDTTPPDEGDEYGGIAAGSIEPIEIQEEMEQSFLDYAMSVIVTRALPDARDGLKPVHRRILWGMHEGGFRPDRSHVKCARVVGDVMGRYHPHGDTAIYDALVRLGQPFSVRHPLIDPHGNFGSPADPPAAMRYTESRLAPLAMRLLESIDEDTVDFVGNFDNSEREPVVLPARFPNLLVNGGQGIAVGMATNIPPHNLGEIIDATVHLLENPEADIDDLCTFVKGPDFPTGCIIMGRAGIREAYRTGRGSMKLRAVTEIIEGDKRDQIVVSAVPFQTSVESISEKIGELVNKREIEGISRVENYSAKGKTQLVIDLKKGASAHVILNQLFKLSPLQTSFSVNMVALVDGVPRTLDLREALSAYLGHQVEVVRRRSEFRLAKARDRAHIVEGLLKALDLIDEIIATIRGSANRAAADEALQAEPFEFTERQAEAILQMTLGRLTRLGREELQNEMDKLVAQIAELEAILGSDAKVREVIKTELIEVRDEFADARVSQITHDEGDLDIEDLIDDEDVVVTLSAQGYIKAMSIDTFRSQGRGGRGVAGARLKDEDVLTHLVQTSAHAYLLFFTNRGRVYRLRAHRVPMLDRTARGTAIVNLLELDADEEVEAIIDTRDYETNRYLFFCTKGGTVKKTNFTEYDKNLKGGFIALGLKEGDELVRVIPTNTGDDIFVTSARGQTIRFAEDAVRPMGRTAAGVRGLKLRDGDQVVGCDVVREEGFLLVMSERGYGKRTEPHHFAAKGRGGLGMRSMKVNDERGDVVGALMVDEGDDIFVINSSGVVIRTRVAEVSIQGRDATGVRVMNLDEGEVVAAIAPAPASEDDPTESDDAAAQPGSDDVEAGPDDTGAQPASEADEA